MTVVERFREAMASLASAVYVVTGMDGDERPRGFTATSVIGHTPDPPALVVSIDRGAHSHDALLDGGRLGINILASGQAAIAELFATKRPDKFARTPHRIDEGVPVIEGAFGHAVCRIVDVLVHGDHSLVVAVIDHASLSAGTPLIYWRRRFHAGSIDMATHDRRPDRRREMASTSQDQDSILDRVAALVPAVEERAAQAEKERAVPEETLDALRDAGVFRIYQPPAFGGAGAGWGLQIEVARMLSRACGSTGWLACVLSTHALMVGRMAVAAQHDVWDPDPDALIATGSARIAGSAEPVDGGYLVSGAWRFASGVDHAQWTMVPAPVAGLGEGPAALRQCLLPVAEYEIVDDWHVAGLRATGSKQVMIPEPIFVPEHRTLGFLEMLGSEPPGAEVNDGYVYRMEFGPYFGMILLGPVLGMAEGALDGYLETTRVRVGAIRGNRIAESEPVQERVAESAAEIAAAGALIDRMVLQMRDRAQRGEFLDSRERAESMRDRAWATRTCVDAVHRLVRQMGAMGLGDDNPVQRQFRDLSAAAAQIGLNWDRNAGTYGKWALGVATGDQAIDGTLPSSGDEAPESVG